MSVPVFTIDAFTSVPFRGNPAAVCWLDAPREPAWMQAVAAEMNLAETAFVEARGDGFGLRWFTPTQEVPLCGHATLASAHMLFTTGRLARGQVARFHTLSGVLTARGDGTDIVLDFPAFPSIAASPPPALLEALGVGPIAMHRIDRQGTDSFWLLELSSEAEVRSVRPRIAAMLAVTPEPVIVTARATTPGFDFVSRFFAPGHGIDEDPVTGGAHCMLGPYWQAKLGRDRFSALQCSTRSGVLRLRLQGPRIEIAGEAVTVAEGRILA